ncbi:MAG: endonuclease/exonuclease/phosphatase family protein [Armatimonadetes bacterium]|nr:endonuclease/exonuclease/phosphatase family protein [Armatimonadota bacterium]
MKKILFFCFVGLLCFSCGNNVSTNPSPEIILDDLFFGTDSTFDVVTWNIQNFPKMNITTANYVVQVIMTIDADVFTLQEIESSSYFDYVISQLNEQDSLYIWDGYRANGASYDVNLAYIYKSDFIQINSIYEIYEDDWFAFPRSPLVFELTYEDEELVIINNHLKAGGGTGDEERRQEASLKLQAFVDSTFSEAEVIIIGDLNDDITEPQATNVFWNFIEDTENYLFADLPIAEGLFANWSYPSWPSHLDHILITNELFDEYENSTVQTILVDHYLEGGWHEYEESISDHRPVGMKFAFE